VSFFLVFGFILPFLGYSQPQFHYWVKKDKAFHHHQSPFISQIQPSVLYFKDPSLKNRISFSTTLAERESYIDERKNWNFVKVPKSATDPQGEKITHCPQDPWIITKILSIYHPCMDTQSVFFASGDATGWAAKAFVGSGHSVLITEPNVAHYDSLITTLKKLIQGDASKKLQKNREQRNAAKWAERQKEKKRAIEEKRTEMCDDLIAKFPSLSKEVSLKIIDIVASTFDDEQTLSQSVRDVASQMAKGLAHININLGGHIYTLTADQWKLITEQLDDDNCKFR
jgi:hypothetical protein